MKRILACLSLSTSLLLSAVALARPPSASTADIDRMDALVERGNAALRAGRPDEAVQLFREAHRAAPSVLQPLRLEAQVLSETGHCREAGPILDKLIARYQDPDHPDNSQATSEALKKKQDEIETHTLPDLQRERERCSLALIEHPTLRVNTTPSGADVRINSLVGPVAGQTPYVTRDLAPGEYQVIVTLDGYRTETRHVELHPGAVLEQTIVLVAEPRKPPAPTTTTTRVVVREVPVYVEKPAEPPRRRWFELGVAGGVTIALYSIDGRGSPPLQASVVATPGVTVVERPSFELKLGALVAFSNLPEMHPSGTLNDIYLTLAFDAAARVPLWRRILLVDVGVGIGAFIVANVPQPPERGVLINGNVMGQNAYTLLTVRPHVGIQARLTDLLFVDATVAYDYTPTDSYVHPDPSSHMDVPNFTVDSFSRIELTAGAGLRF